MKKTNLEKKNRFVFRRITNYFLMLLLLLTAQSIFAQNVGIGTTTPDNSAML